MEAGIALVRAGSRTGDAVFVAWQTEAVFKNETIIAISALVLGFAIAAFTAYMASDDLL